MKYSGVCVILIALTNGLAVEGQLPQITYPAKVLPSGECQSPQPLLEIDEDVQNLLAGIVQNTTNPGNFSCGGTSGWRRIVYVDTDDSSHQCPSSFREYTTPVRACGRQETLTASCDSAYFGDGNSYTQVCGRIIGYQVGTPAAFHEALQDGTTIESWYIEGISLTHGSPRQHIWSFGATPGEGYSTSSSDPSLCPCSNTAVTYSTPSFVGNDYFCETGTTLPCCPKGMFFSDDPLWDGQNCGADSTCCSHNTPPWFYKELSVATRNDVEVRICSDMGTNQDDTPFKVLELYVK